MKVNEFEAELKRVKEEFAKLPPLSEKDEKRLDLMAELLLEDFYTKLTEGKLRKPEKRGRQSVRK